MLNLPKSKDGKPYISYSQFNAWRSLKGYNLGILGRYEYMRSYFWGEKYEDRGGFGSFGSMIEKAIEEQNFKGFTKPQTALLKQVDPLDIAQKELFIDMGNFLINGYIDFASEDLSYIKDLKTASDNSKKRYFGDDWKQLHIYAVGVKQITGNYPQRIHVEILERKGNPFKGEPLTLGTQKWDREFKISLAEYEQVIKDFNECAEEISDYYTFWKKINR